MSEKPLVVGHSYLAKHTTRSVKARVTKVRHRVNVNTLTHEPTLDLHMNGIAVVEVETSRPLFFDLYDESRSTGSFILIDPISNATVAAGMILEDRSKSTVTDPARSGREIVSIRSVNPTERFERHGHRPAAFLLRNDLLESAERALFAAGFETIVLRSDALKRESFSHVFDLLHSAGFVVLIDVEDLNIAIQQKVEQHGERIVFDLSGNTEQASGGELISKVLAHAESLRLPEATERGD